MLENFDGYFNEIGLPMPLRERAEQVCLSFSALVREPLQSAFIGDFHEPEGARRYTSLWLVSERQVIEVKNFPVMQQVDCTPIRSISYVEFTRNDLASFEGLVAPTTTLQALVVFDNPVRAMLSASGNNCRHLYSMVTRHLLPPL